MHALNFRSYFEEYKNTRVCIFFINVLLQEAQIKTIEAVTKTVFSNDSKQHLQAN